MTSQINPNNIDGNYPVAGQPNNTQGMRDNFTNTKTNLQYAADEISDLQSKVVLKAGLTGTTLDNNMNGGVITDVKLNDVGYSYLPIVATSGSIDIDYSAAGFQQINPSAPVSLNFTNWPVSGTAGTVQVGFNVTNVSQTLTLPAAVSQGLGGLEGVSPGTPGVSNTITFGAIGNYAFEFVTVDGGTTVWLFDNSRPKDIFYSPLRIVNTTVSTSSTTGALVVTGGVGIGGNLNVGGLTALTGNITGNLNVTGNIAAGNIRTTGISTSGTVSVTGNITAGNLNAAGLNLSSNVVSALNSTSNITTTSNIAGGNVRTTGIVSASGNITGNYFIGNGSQLTGVTASSVNANALTGNTLNSGVIFSSLTSVGTLGNLSVSGNVIAGNLNAAGLSLSSNVVSALNSTSNITTTSNIAGGNVLTTGIVSASGNITGGNILTGGVIAGNIEFGAGSVSGSGNITGGNILFGAGSVAGTGNITVAGTGGISLTSTGTAGYGVGAGGTIAQSGNKGQTVILNKPAGEITMQNTLLAGDAAVSFTFTNSTIAARDLLLINLVGGGTPGAYFYGSNCTTGSAVITVRNLTAGGLSEALVLRYAVIKGSIT